MMDEWVNLKCKKKKLDNKKLDQTTKGNSGGQKSQRRQWKKMVAEKRTVRKKKRKKQNVVNFSSPSWACPSSSPQTLRSAWPSSTSSSPRVAPLELRLGQHAPAR